MLLSRIDKVLVSQNVGTRKEVQKLIRKGEVTIDGNIERDYSKKIDPEINIIKISGEILVFHHYMYIMMNKPAGVVSASRDPKKKTVLDLVPEKLYRRNLFPAGRLDIDTEGLLIITNDGNFSHKMLSPVKKVYKIYEALINGVVTFREIAEFKKGISLENGEVYLPAELKIIKNDGKNSVVEVRVCQGKFHQVKRMFLAVGLKVLHLKRKQIGNLRLDDKLRLGDCREMTPAEIDLIFK